MAGRQKGSVTSNCDDFLQENQVDVQEVVRGARVTTCPTRRMWPWSMAWTQMGDSDPAKLRQDMLRYGIRMASSVLKKRK
jgi:hypothetical protein